MGSGRKPVPPPRVADVAEARSVRVCLIAGVVGDAVVVRGRRMGWTRQDRAGVVGWLVWLSWSLDCGVPNSGLAESFSAELLFWWLYVCRW